MNYQEYDSELMGNVYLNIIAIFMLFALFILSIFYRGYNNIIAIIGFCFGIFLINYILKQDVYMFYEGVI